MKRACAWALAVALLMTCTSLPLRGQEPAPASTDPQKLYEAPWPSETSKPPNPPDPFAPGNITFEALSGYYARTHLGAHGPALNYLPEAVRVGLMVGLPWDDCLPWQSRCELLLEANFSPIITSYGSYLVGPNAIARYNFLSPHGILVPYIQGGAGFVFNDAWQDRMQGQVGEAFEFLLRAEVGTRVKLSDCLYLNVEGGFQHISNAGMASRNGGINDVGVSVGFTWFFPQ
jgi:hypothetical protein